LALWVAVIFLPFLVLCAALGWATARGVLSNVNSGVLMLVPTAGIAAAIYGILYAAKRQLRRRFLAREAMAFEQWFERHYPADEVSPEVARTILGLVAKGIGGGVQPVQVLPTDRLEDFVHRLCGAAIDSGILLDSPLECLGEDGELGEWFEERTGRPLEIDPAWSTIDEVIRGVSARLRS